ncbi:hypothetical protein PPERSA_11019 [Pseudocohnilembus persalinus]|uniref:Uncharacterized protein n=1 Tax=Pseudocohnilembus persalinus TaxID=266149 RepID=A0A0V0QZ13_PSEPJ|nr:hypothetical protein PPERSA_11019 [Pseudocohnilembus persalinus]|eukprot:KRX07470.1 hypothetical protein PPERSA_11019 [Pseudocohnilembus persalinus]
MLRCFTCSNEDKESNKKISIEQILKLPASKIQNFPPLLDQNNDKQVRQIIENFTEEKVQHFKEYIIKQIKEHYQQKIEILKSSQKDVIRQFDQMMEFADVSKYYNIDELKKTLNQFKNKEINLQDLFKKQLRMKEQFQNEQTVQLLLNTQKKQEEILNQLENFKLNLDKKFNDFTENSIKIDTKYLERLQSNIKQALLGSYFENHIDFYKIGENQGEIQIENNSRLIKIDNLTNFNQKVVHSQLMHKNRKYHFKIKINFHEKKNQQIAFFLINSNDVEKDWINENYIFISDYDGDCGANNGESSQFQGQKFSSFWKDNETVLNLVFNVDEKIFEIYDDQKKGYIKNVINSEKIQGEKVMLGINFYQVFKNKIDLTITDIIIDYPLQAYHWGTTRINKRSVKCKHFQFNEEHELEYISQIDKVTYYVQKVIFCEKDNNQQLSTVLQIHLQNYQTIINQKPMKIQYKLQDPENNVYNINLNMSDLKNDDEKSKQTNVKNNFQNQTFNTEYQYFNQTNETQ